MWLALLSLKLLCAKPRKLTNFGQQRQKARKPDLGSSMSVARIYPFAENVEVDESCLSDWQSGQDKPSEDGHYLREFVEGEAISEFRDGQWLFDGFFPSDIQDAPWRGLLQPLDLAQMPLTME